MQPVWSCISSRSFKKIRYLQHIQKLDADQNCHLIRPASFFARWINSLWCTMLAQMLKTCSFCLADHRQTWICTNLRGVVGWRRTSTYWDSWSFWCLGFSNMVQKWRQVVMRNLCSWEKDVKMMLNIDVGVPCFGTHAWSPMTYVLKPDRWYRPTSPGIGRIFGTV